MSKESDPTTTNNDNTTCKGCQAVFPSRNAIFKHLLHTQGACLNDTDRAEFHQHILSQQRIKVLLLIGYIMVESSSQTQINSTVTMSTSVVVIQNGEDVAFFLQHVLAEHLKVDPKDADLRLLRAYGHTSHGTSVVAQDEGTGALTEVVAVRLPPLMNGVQDWINVINTALQRKLDESSSTCEIRVLGRFDLPQSAHKLNPEMDFSHRRIEYMIPMDFFWQPSHQSNGGHGGIQNAASMKELFRQIFSFDDQSSLENANDPSAESGKPVHYSRQDKTLLGVKRPSHETLLFMHSLKKKMQMLTTQVEKLDTSDPAAMKEKEYSQQKRQNMRSNQKQATKNNKRPKKGDVDADAGEKLKDSNELTMDRVIDSAPSSNGNDKETKTHNRGDKVIHVLRRKRFHNFTPSLMAHEFLAFRRVDRFYHRATLRFEPENDSGSNQLRLLDCNTKDTSIRPFLVLSVSGDLFLTGQVPRLVGLFLAMATGEIDTDIVDCVFDENYPHLVPTPPAPLFAMCAAEAFYTKWEGKLKTILTPRQANHFTIGWNDTDTLQRVHDWTNHVRERTAQAWMQGGIVGSDDERLALAQQWIEDVLQPWAVRAREQLKDYRQWKASTTDATTNDASTLVPPDNKITSMRDATPLASEEPSSLIPVGTVNLPPLISVDPTVPALYEKVLFYLRQADSSGLWPSTTPKRQLVMISTVKEGVEDQGDPATASSLAQALERAQSSQPPDSVSRSSAYIFEEGQGGASGSFSVGAMPDGQNSQPRANSLFPQLMKAAFELEIALRPDREPSSTIAVNRNAQFRPHTDSGAGVGQGTSLIVGLGTYVGGELVVEGEMKDIRYKAIEFNGWKQRHWTMPFAGERYSLVWFTPKGCEGVRGIDLCKDIQYD